MEELFKKLKTLKSIGSTNDKKRFIKANEDDLLFKTTLKFLLNDTSSGINCVPAGGILYSLVITCFSCKDISKSLILPLQEIGREKYNWI